MGQICKQFLRFFLNSIWPASLRKTAPKVKCRSFVFNIGRRSPVVTEPSPPGLPRISSTQTFKQTNWQTFATWLWGLMRFKFHLYVCSPWQNKHPKEFTVTVCPPLWNVTNTLQQRLRVFPVQRLVQHNSARACRPNCWLQLTNVHLHTRAWIVKVLNRVVQQENSCTHINFKMCIWYSGKVNNVYVKYVPDISQFWYTNA